ncbi:aminotransferase class I/II-fold pyridoxal phosphate-dependent enzyme [Kushneria avicenniae]
MSQHYGIKRHEWLDLSTGINPWPYPITPIDAKACQSLPDQDQALHEAALHYYFGKVINSDDGRSLMLLNIPGSQWAIETLPLCFEPGRVALPDIGYREHQWHWQKAGHTRCFYDADHPEAVRSIASDADNLRAVVVVNPNNPGGQHIAPDALRALADELNQKGAVLIVDEAFVDATPGQSLLPNIADNIIVLRSLGKFFGLAGLRLGAIAGAGRSAIMQQLSSMQGPWRVTAPSQRAGQEALNDHHWQIEMQTTLERASREQGRWLAERLMGCDGATRWRQSALFNGFDMPLAHAQRWHDGFLQQAVLTRLWVVNEQHAILRFGLHDESLRAGQQLRHAMRAVQRTTKGYS